MRVLKWVGRTSLVICVLYAIAVVFFGLDSDIPNWFVVLNVVAVVCFLIHMVILVERYQDNVDRTKK